MSCSQRAGNPVSALNQDLTQFSVHQEAWNKARRAASSLTDRARDRTSGLAEAAIEEGASEAISHAAEAIAEEVPGLGVVVRTTTGILRYVRERHQDEKLLAAVQHIGGQQESNWWDDLAADVTRFARHVPLVVFVEDLHAADAGLVELVERLIRSSTKTLVVTTGWPKATASAEQLEALRALPEPGSGVSDRCTVLSFDSPVPEQRLSELDLASREALTHALVGDDADPGSVRRLAGVAQNPYLIELVCRAPKFRNRRPFRLESDELARLPRTVEAFLADQFDSFTPDQRYLLVLAALGSPPPPNGVSADWEHPFLVELVERCRRSVDDTIPELAVRLGDASSGYDWVRLLDEELDGLIGPQQYGLLMGRLGSDYPLDQLRAELIHLVLSGIDDLSEHGARIVIAAALDGLIGPGVEVNQAIALVSDDPRLFSRVEHLIDLEVLDNADDPETLFTRFAFAMAVAGSGRTDEAIALHETLLADQTRVLGPDSESTLLTRSFLAILIGGTGRTDEAIALHETLLNDRTRVLGPNHPHTLTTRNNLARVIDKAGRTGQAIDLHETLLNDRTRVLGPNHPHTLTTRNNLANLIDKAGRTGQAIALHETLLNDRTRVLGPNHPDTLNTRNNLAYLRSRRTLESVMAGKREALSSCDGLSDLAIATIASIASEYTQDFSRDGRSSDRLIARLARFWPTGLDPADLTGTMKLADVSAAVRRDGEAHYHILSQANSASVLCQIERQILEQLIDQYSKSHMDKVSELIKDTPHYADSDDPSTMARTERRSAELLEQAMASFDTDFLRYIMHVRVAREDNSPEQPSS